MKKRSKSKKKKSARKNIKAGSNQQDVNKASDINLEFEDKNISPQSNINIHDSQPDIDNSHILSQAKKYWLFADWNKLIVLDMETVSNSPEREIIAILLASAYQQLGKQKKAEHHARIALEWGCSPKLVAKILISGVHITLGRIAALKNDEKKVEHHFKESVAIIESRDTDLFSHTRAVREITRMGLLSQAAGLVEGKIQNAAESKLTLRKERAFLNILKTEIELLNHELILAQRRHQLFPQQDSKYNNLINFDEPDYLNELRKRSMSQLGQDIWVLQETNFKRNGFFVEFGATNGVLLSNTYLLEKEFSWYGICAEPNPKYIDELHKNRNCIISDVCVGAKTGEKVEFVFADAYGTIKKHLNDDMHAKKRSAYFDMDQVKTLETISLHDFLKQNDAPHVIDYMSIDTEGSEYEILESFPFDKWDIHLLTIEHNYSVNKDNIQKLMENNGYFCIEKDFDYWFQKIE